MTREIDLVEEVARIHGYDTIPEDVNVPMAASHRTERDRVLEKIREVLISAGVDEAMTISLVEPNVAAVFSPWTDLPPLESSTPVLRRANRLRTSLIPSLLEARRNNEAIGNQRIELFEIARVYLPAKTGLPDERLMLGITRGGDFLAVKGLVEAIVERLNPSAVVEVADFEHSLFKTARACELKAAGKRIGFLGEVSAAALKSFELRQPTTVVELEIAALESLFQPVPRGRAFDVPRRFAQLEPRGRGADSVGQTGGNGSQCRGLGPGDNRISRHVPRCKAPGDGKKESALYHRAAAE